MYDLYVVHGAFGACGPLIFNIFMNDLFIETTTLYNDADDSTMCSSGNNTNIVISRLGADFTIISACFDQIYMVLLRR